VRATIETVGGVTTRYLHHGSGDYGVLLLHGVGVSADSFLWNLEALGGDNCQAIAPDLLGYGMTGEGDYKEGAPQDGIVEHLMTLIEHLGLSKVVIIGSSFGANVAVHLFWRMPARTDGLVLVGCGPALNSVETLASMYEQSFANGIKAMADPTLDTCRRRMNNLVFDPKRVPEALVLLQLTLYALPGARDRYERRMRGIKDRAALERFDVTSKISQVTPPSLVIWGRQDVRGSLQEAERAAKSLPDGQWVLYEECGHLPYLEHPDRFNAQASEFIDRVRGGSRARDRGT
jgi:2-hydroxy-6-oxonona-2,4-dienedioate hydrolase